MIYTDPYTGEQEYKYDIFDDYQVGLGKNSWYIKKPLQECHSVFQSIQTDIYAHAFICKCGHEEINPPKIKNYRCPVCDSSGFYNVEDFYCKDDVLLANVDEDPELHLDQSTASLRLFVKVPQSIDLSRDKVVFQKEEVFLLRIELDGGKQSEDGMKVSEDVKEYAHHRLLHFIALHYLQHKLIGYDRYFLDKTYPQLRKGVLFFLKYPEFRHVEFIKWPMDEDLYHEGGLSKRPEVFLEYIRAYRTERSIKRALYRRYLSDISVGKFDAVTPYVLCRTFKDPNLLCSLLESNFVITYQTELNLKSSANRHIRLIEFLQRFYSEKQLVSILSKGRKHLWLLEDNTRMQVSESVSVSVNETWLWEDSVRMLNSFELVRIMEIFSPPRANMRAIHDALVYSVNLAEANYISVAYNFSEEVKKPCVLWEEIYEMILPKDSNELVDWSKSLNNCLYSYVSDVYEGDTLIYGVKINGELVYAIEIKNGQLSQFKGKYNAEPDEKVRRAIGLWYIWFFTMSKENNLEDKEKK